jgi:magnesium transporter
MSVSSILVQRPGGGFDDSVKLESISDIVPDRETVLWLDIQDPTEADLELLRNEFGFHELALEDVVRRHQRAKVDEYEGYLFVVFYAVGKNHVHEVNLFVGENYLVTVHQGEVPEISDTANRWQKDAGRIEHGVGVLVYSLLDTIVDGYFPVIDHIAERVDSVEREIFETKRNCLPDLFAMKRQLIRLRRTLGPERDALNVFLRHDDGLFKPATRVYFQDIYDHTIRVLDTIDLYRDQLSSMLDAYLSVSSNRLNFVMKRMTALATILMSLTVITGVYGMNFALTPSNDWRFGFWFAIGSMFMLALGLVAYFRRIDWL